MGNKITIVKLQSSENTLLMPSKRMKKVVMDVMGIWIELTDDNMGMKK